MTDTPAPPPHTPEAIAAWHTLVTAAQAYAPHLGQWDRFKFQTDHGMVYVTIGRDDDYPGGFEEIVT